MRYRRAFSSGSSKKKKRRDRDFSLDRDNPFFEQFRKKFLIDDSIIFKHFKQPYFLRYMNENFRMLPFLFENNKIVDYRQEFVNNEQFQRHVKDWFKRREQDRLAEIDEFAQDRKITPERLIVLQPFIDLYIDFIQQNYREEYEISSSLSQKTDLRLPHTWFPRTRELQRRIIYHAGPTNSGKTFATIEDLTNSETGIYCAPLRLLAWEIQEKLEKRGVSCNLITGQEKILRDDAKHTSCTIETANFNESYKVAVIDEIQMIGDEDRGAAWTNALLGLHAETIHLCGDPRALSLVDRICQITGDKFEERHYQRFSSLFVENKPFKLEEDLRPGDCIITFSTRDVHKLKNKINKLASEDDSNTCAVVYGKLPPETRKDQARKFNDPESDVNYLVATDAIGMGVNFLIKRVIFQTLMRRRNDERVQIDDYEIRQIAGRAGRYLENGFVTCMNNSDLKVVRRSINAMSKRMGKSSIPEAEIIGLPPKEKKNKRKHEDPEEIVIHEEVGEFTLRQKGELKRYMKTNLGEDEEESEALESEEEAVYRPSRHFKPEERRIQQAGLFPSFAQIESFERDLRMIEKKPSTMSEIFKKFVSLAQIEGIYFIQAYEDFCTVKLHFHPSVTLTKFH